MAAADDAEPGDKRPRCPMCGHPQREDCDGQGWLEALGPYRDGSYITSRPCTYANPWFAD